MTYKLVLKYELDDTQNQLGKTLPPITLYEGLSEQKAANKYEELSPNNIDKEINDCGKTLKGYESFKERHLEILDEQDEVFVYSGIRYSKPIYFHK